MRWTLLKSVVLLVAVSVASGCYHWVPIEAARYADGRAHHFDQVRVGPPEGGEVLQHAQLTYPILVAEQAGRPVFVDLLQTPAQERKLRRLAIAGIVVGSVLGGLVVVAGFAATRADGGEHHSLKHFH